MPARVTVSSASTGPGVSVGAGTGSGRGGVVSPPTGGVGGVGGVGGLGGVGVAATLPTLPVQNDVFLRAPAQVKEMCTWLVCGSAPVYLRQPDEAE